MALLILVRHGMSEANAAGLLSGGACDSPLTAAGREQARRVGASLAGIPFDAIYSSTQTRGRETAAGIQAFLGPVPHFVHQELKERHWGTVDGRFLDNRDRKYTPDELHAWTTWDIAPPGGESYAQVAARVVGFFEITLLPQLRAGKNLLLVGHNGMLRPLRRHLEGLPVERTHGLGFANGEVCAYEIDTDGRGTRLSFDALPRPKDSE